MSLSTLNVLLECFNALDVLQFELNDNVFDELFQNKNPQRLFDFSVSNYEKDIKTLFFIFAISERLRLNDKSFFTTEVFSLYLLVDYIIGLLEQDIYCDYYEDEIMPLFSQYIFIPLIVKQLDNNVLKYLDGLLPTNEINIAEKFMELFGLNPNLEYSSLNIVKIYLNFWKKILRMRLLKQKIFKNLCAFVQK